MGHSGPKVKEIFVAALDHEPGADRTAYLDEACRGDAELRLRVDVLLRAHERAHDVLGPTSEPVVDEPTVLPTASPLATAEPAPTLAADADPTAADATRDEVLARTGAPWTQPSLRPAVRPGTVCSAAIAFDTSAITRSSRSWAGAAWGSCTVPAR